MSGNRSGDKDMIESRDCILCGFWFFVPSTVPGRSPLVLVGQGVDDCLRLSPRKLSVTGAFPFWGLLSQRHALGCLEWGHVSEVIHPQWRPRNVSPQNLRLLKSFYP